MLDINKIKVASPCSVPWESMDGDERSRMCSECGLAVHNIAELNVPEIQQLIASRGERLCVRLYRRPDGTVITRDCPKGVRVKIRSAARVASAAATAALSFVLAVHGQRSEDHEPKEKVTAAKRMNTAAAGEMKGVVTDPNGAVVPGVDVILTLPNGKQIRAMTDAEGRYVFTGVEAGANLSLRFGPTTFGFRQMIVEKLKMRNGEGLSVDVSLDVSDATVVVGIFFEEDTIDIRSSTVETKITRRKLDTIPYK